MGKLPDSAAALLQVLGVEEDATEREVHVLFSGCAGFLGAGLIQDGTAKMGLAHFESAELAFRAASARQGSTWSPDAQPVLLRPVPNLPQEAMRTPRPRSGVQPLNLSSLRKASPYGTPRSESRREESTPATPRTPRTPKSPRTPTSWTPNSSVRRSPLRRSAQSFRSSLSTQPTPEALAMERAPARGQKQAKLALKRAADKRVAKGLAEALADARQLGLNEEDPDLLRADALLNALLQPVDARCVMMAHARATTKLKQAWPSAAQDAAKTPRPLTPRQRAVLQDAVCAADAALSLSGQQSGGGGSVGVERATRRTLRAVSASWVSQAWRALEDAWAAKDLRALGKAVDACSAAREALASSESAAQPESEMLDKLAAASRICQGVSSFKGETARLSAYSAVRRALGRRGSASAGSAELEGPPLAEALEEVLRQGGAAGDTEDDCIGQAIEIRSLMVQQLPARWGLWSALLLGKAAVLWEAVPCLAQVQKAVDNARIAGLPDAALSSAFALEQRFCRHFRSANALDEALETGQGLAECLRGARVVAREGGAQLVQTNIRRAGRALEGDKDLEDLEVGAQTLREVAGAEEGSPEVEGAPVPDLERAAQDNLAEALALGAESPIRAALKRGRDMQLESQLLEEGESFLRRRELISSLQLCVRRGDAPALEAALRSADGELQSWDRQHFAQKLEELRSASESTKAKLSAIKLRTITFCAFKCRKDGHWDSLTSCAQISAEGQQTIVRIAACLQDYPGLAVRVEGHSNDSNSQRAKVVSQARADCVMAALKEAGCTNWMVAHGWGLSHSIKKKIVRILPEIDGEQFPAESSLADV